MPGDIEPNLCNAGSDVWPDCQGFGRVEVQVSRGLRKGLVGSGLAGWGLEDGRQHC